MSPFLRWQSKILLAVFILNGVFLLALEPREAQAVHDPVIYQKPYDGTLSYTEWNGLFSDFVNNWLPVSLNGPVGIATPAPASGLSVNGPINATNLFTTSNVGIGTTNPDKQLHVAGYAKFDNFAYGLTPSLNDTAALATVEYVNLKAGGSGGVGTGTSGQTLRHDGTGWVGSSVLFNNGTNIGIGTTTPTAKLDINGSLRWGGGQIISSSDLINIFPYDKLIDSWEPTKKVFRYYVDGVSGSDSNNGGKMSTAFRQIQKAIDQLPSDLRGYEVYILVGEGTYSPVNVTRISNGTLTFEWIGTGIESGTASNFKSWVLQGESGVITRNGAAQIISPDTTVAFKKEAGGLPLAIRFFSYERLNGQENVSWSNNYGARWRFGATGNAEWLITIFDQVSYFFAPQIELDLGNADGGMALDSSFTIWNIRIYGGSGLASVAPAWSWKVPIALISPNNTWQELCAWVGYKDSSMPLGSYVYLEGVKDAIRTGDRTDAFLDTGRCYEGGNKFRYAQGSSAFAKSNIYADPFFKGMMVRNDSEFNFIDTSQDFHSVINTVNGKIDAISNNSNNFGIGTVVPPSKLSIYRAESNTPGNTTLGFNYNGVDDLFGFRLDTTHNLNLDANYGGWLSTPVMTFQRDNGNVGVGTTTPAKKFAVGGAAKFDGFAYALTPVQTDTAALATVEYVNLKSGGSGGVGSGTSGQTLRHDGTGWVGSSVLFNNGTNVGIGTSTPASKLFVDGGAINVGDGAGSYSGFQFSSGALTQTNNNAVKLLGALQVTSTAGGNSYISGTGNVGIGTTTPGQKLEVAGNISIGNNSLIMNDVSVRRSTGGVPWTTVEFKPTSGDKDVVFRFVPSGIADSGVMEWFNNHNIVDAGALDDYSRVIFKSWSDKFTISNAIDGYGRGVLMPILMDATGLSTYTQLALATTGKVGIGTTTPGKLLHVAGQALFEDYPRLNGLTPSQTDTYALATVEYVNLKSGGSGGVGSGTSGQTLRHDGTGWVGSSVLFNNGTNVGIGTTGPSGKLDVTGLATAYPSATITAGDLVVDTANGIVYVGKTSNTAGDNSIFKIRNRTGAVTTSLPGDGSQLAYINNNNVSFNGNVGIGTTAPYAPLQVGVGDYSNHDSNFVSIKNITAPSGSYGARGGLVEVQLKNNVPSGQRYWGMQTALITNAGYTGNFTSSETVNPILTGGEYTILHNSAGTVNSIAGSMVFSNTGSGAGAVGNMYGTYNSINPSSVVSNLYGFYIKQGGTATPTNTYGIYVSALTGTNKYALVTEAGSGNVGIGTTTPGKLLHVAGQALFEDYPRLNGLTPSQTDTYALATVEYVNLKSGGAGGVGSGTSGQTLRHDGTGWVGNSTLFNNGTSVGIGTTNPLSLFTVYSGATSYQAVELDFARDNAGSGGLVFSKSRGTTGSRTQVLNGDRLADINFRGYTDANSYSLEAARIRVNASENFTSSANGGEISFQTTPNGSTTIAERMRITNGGNVGIGTTNPSGDTTKVLDIYGSGGSGIFFHNDTSGATASDGLAVEQVGLNAYVYNREAGFLQFATNNAAAMTILSGGNVGIGTTTPAYPLDLVQSAVSTIRMKGNTSAAGYWVASALIAESNVDYRGRGLFLPTTDASAGNAWWMGVPYTGGGFQIGNSDYHSSLQSDSGPYNKPYAKLFITTAGNVGIGTTTPGKQLEVGGTGQAKFNGLAYGITPSSTVTDALTTVEYVNASLVNGTGPWRRTAPYIYPSNITDNVGIGVTNPGAKLETITNVVNETPFQISTGGNAKWRWTNSGNPVVQQALEVYNSTGALKMYFNPNSDSFFNGGNVGIGTTGPNVKLDVAGNMFVRGAGTYYNNAGAAELQIGYGLAAPTTVGSVTRLALQPYAHTGGPWNFISRDDASNAWLDIKYGSTAGFTLKHDGSVGIGTTNPSTKIDIESAGASLEAISMGSATQTQYTNLLWYSDGGTGQIWKAGSGYSSWGGVNAFNIYNSAGPIAFHPNGVGNVLFLSSGGNVGIGLTNPGKQLEVGGTGQAKFNGLAYGITPSSTVTDALTTVEYVNASLVNGTGPWKKTTTNIYPSTITDNVGIGTASPGGKLVINNAGATQLRLTDTTYSANLDINFGGAPDVAFGNGNAGARIRVPMSAPSGQATGEIQFWTSKQDVLSQQMVIDKFGNVGIGTTTPTVKLDVNGDLKVSGTVYADIMRPGSFQKNISASWWDPNSIIGRIFVDGANGNDANDGATWTNAKKTLQGALNIIPTQSGLNTIIIAFTPGTYVGATLPYMINNGIELWRVDNDYNTSSSASAVWMRNGGTIPTTPADLNTPLTFTSDSNSKFFNFGASQNNRLVITSEGPDGNQKWGMFVVKVENGGALALNVINNSVDIRHAVFDASSHTILQDAVISFWQTKGLSIIRSLGIIGNTSNTAFTQRSGWRAFISMRGDPGPVSILPGQSWLIPNFNPAYPKPHGKPFDVKTVNDIIADWYGDTTEFKTDNKNAIVNLGSNIYIDNSALGLSTAAIVVTQGSTLEINVDRSLVDIVQSGTPGYSRYTDPVANTYETYVSQNIKDFKLANGTTNVTLNVNQVGIGITNPSSGKLLQVAGQAKFDQLAYGITPTLTATDALATVEYVNASLTNGTGPWRRTAPYIYPSTLADNVGIGVTNPEGLLHVNSPSNQIILTPSQSGTETADNIGLEIRSGNYVTGMYATRFVKSDKGGGIPLFVQNNESGDTSTWVDTARFGSYSGNANKFETFGQTALATVGGNVGIGTTNPTDKLSITGSARIIGNVSANGISTPSLASIGLNSASYLYGITNSPTWNVASGSYVNNNATAPDNTTTAGTYTLSTTSWDLYQGMVVTSGAAYKAGVWVKLGTATNFCIVVNNTSAWNTVGGKCFTSADGLSTSGWTYVSYSFVSPGAGINLHIGAHSENNLPQQTSGTVYVWNWEVTKQNGGTMISTFTGNVGVGTANPRNLLDLGTSYGVGDVGRKLALYNDGTYFTGFSVHSGALGISSNTTAGQADSMTIITGGNVGIGLTNPGKQLEVGGTGQAKFNGWAYGITPGITQTDALATVEYVNASLVNGTGPWKKTTTNIYPSTITDNVGIGTTAPARRLHISGNNTTGVEFQITNTDMVSGGRNFNIAADTTGTDHWDIRTLTDDSTALSNLFMSFQTGTGNVGIGTTNPDGKLSVSGDIRGGSFSTGWNSGEARYGRASDRIAGIATLQLGGGAGAATRWEIVDSEWTKVIASIDNRAPGSSFTIDSSGLTSFMGGNVGIGTTNPGAKMEIFNSYTPTTPSFMLRERDTADYALTINPYVVGGSNVGYKFSTQNAGGAFTDAMAITGGGNVGIGLTNPGKQLEVGGTGQAKFNGWAYGITPSITQTDALATVEYVNGQISGNSWTKGGDTVTSLKTLGTISNYSLPFITNNTERMRLTDAGNLVIGATSTTVRLHVESPQGPVALFSSRLNGGTYSGYIGNGQTVSAEEFGLYYALNDAKLAVYDVASASLMYGNGITINNNNNKVGIGTTAPTDNLQIGDYTGSKSVSITAADGVNFAELKLREYNNSYGMTFRLDSNLDLLNILYHNADGTGVSAAVISRINGNVGIGTTAPNKPLHVAGQARFGQLAYGITPASTVTDALATVEYVNAKAGGAGGVGTGTSGQTLRHNGTGWVADSNLFNNGTYVGIGLTNPSQKLEVSGTVLASNFYAPSIENFKQNGSLTNKVIVPDTTQIAQSPIAGFLWHDILAFNKNGAPIFQTSTDGTIFNNATLDNRLFSHIESQSIPMLDASSMKAVRWVWNNNGSLGWSMAQWLVLAYAYTADPVNATITVDSSANGTTWTNRHTSNFTGYMAPYWLYLSYWAGETYLRITITSNVSSGHMNLSSIRILTSRWGDQGYGSEMSYPYIWDANQNIGIGTSPAAKLHVASDGVNAGFIYDTTGNDGPPRQMTIKTAGQPVINFGSYPGSWTSAFIIQNNDNTRYIWMNPLASNSGANARIITGGSGLDFMPGNTLAMSLKTDGNVGIGTTAPGKQLEVGGTGQAKFNGLAYGITPALTQTDALATVEYVNASLINGTGAWARTAPYVYPSTITDNVGIGITNPQAALQVNGGMIMKRTTVADADYTALVTDYIIGYTSISANRTVTLPSALCTPGRFFVILDESGSASGSAKIIIDPEGATPIVGQATFSLAGPYNSVYVFCGSSAWYVL